MPTVTAGTTVVWKSWVSDGTASTFTTSSSNNVWNIWCDSSTATSTSNSSTSVWISWNEEYVFRSDGNNIVYQYKPTPETEEQKQARLQAEEQRRIEADARRKSEQEAKEKAERLLISQLNPVQLKQLKEMDAFIVQLESRRYKIRRGYKVIELDKDDKQVAQYCIHPSELVPQADTMLAQKLLLEHDEAAFLRIANRTPVVQ